MTAQLERSQARPNVSIILSAILAVWCATAASAQDQDLPALVARVDPSVVKIRVGKHIGSGFVVDASGIIVTCYHVFKGASEAIVVLPGDKGKDMFIVAASRVKQLLAKAAKTARPLSELPPARKSSNNAGREGG